MWTESLCIIVQLLRKIKSNQWWLKVMEKITDRGSGRNESYRDFQVFSLFRPCCWNNANVLLQEHQSELQGCGELMMTVFAQREGESVSQRPLLFLLTGLEFYLHPLSQRPHPQETMSSTHSFTVDNETRLLCLRSYWTTLFQLGLAQGRHPFPSSYPEPGPRVFLVSVIFQSLPRDQRWGLDHRSDGKSKSLTFQLSGPVQRPQSQPQTVITTKTFSYFIHDLYFINTSDCC